MADISRVAPELAPALEFFPNLDFNHGMPQCRTDFGERPRRPLPEELEAVECRQHFIPGTAGDPDVRVLHYAAAGRRPRRHVCAAQCSTSTAAAMCWAIPKSTTPPAARLPHGPGLRGDLGRLPPGAGGGLARRAARLPRRAGVAARPRPAKLGIDPARIAVAGRERRRRPCRGAGAACPGSWPAAEPALRTYPALRLCCCSTRRCSTTAPAPPSDPHPHTGDFVWTPAQEPLRLGRAARLSRPAAPTCRLAAVPARAADLSGLPPHFISVGALDLFLEEDLEWTRRLARAAVAGGTPRHPRRLPRLRRGAGQPAGRAIAAMATCRRWPGRWRDRRRIAIALPAPCSYLPPLAGTASRRIVSSSSTQLPT